VEFIPEIHMMHTLILLFGQFDSKFIKLV